MASSLPTTCSPWSAGSGPWSLATTAMSSGASVTSTPATRTTARKRQAKAVIEQIAPAESKVPSLHPLDRQQRARGMAGAHPADPSQCPGPAAPLIGQKKGQAARPSLRNVLRNVNGRHPRARAGRLELAPGPAQPQPARGQTGAQAADSQGNGRTISTQAPKGPTTLHEALQ